MSGRDAEGSQDRRRAGAGQADVRSGGGETEFVDAEFWAGVGEREGRLDAGETESWEDALDTSGWAERREDEGRADRRDGEGCADGHDEGPADGHAEGRTDGRKDDPGADARKRELHTGRTDGRTGAPTHGPSAAVRRARRRRRAGLIIVLALVVAGVVVLLEQEPTVPVAAPVAASSESPQLARGGTRVLPNYQVVAYYGAPQAPELGVLGLTPPEEAVNVLNVRSQEYADLSGKPVYPAFELISTVAQEAPGPSGEYRFHQKKSLIEDYLRVATESDFLLILDIQPGRANFVDEVKRLKPFLRNPNVGIALDPEWHLPNGVPGEEIGQVDAKVINQVAKLMSEQAQDLELPQKLLIVHQFTEEMVRNDDKLRNFPKVAMVMNADGFGTPGLKQGTYDRLAPRDQPPYAGFKLFFTEDTGVMSAQEVLELRPRPEVVVYE